MAPPHRGAQHMSRVGNMEVSVCVATSMCQVGRRDINGDGNTGEQLNFCPSRTSGTTRCKIAELKPNRREKKKTAKASVRKPR